MRSIYVATEPCGCFAGALAGDTDHPKDRLAQTAAALTGWINARLVIDRMTRERYDALPAFCSAHQPSETPGAAACFYCSVDTATGEPSITLTNGRPAHASCNNDALESGACV